jgi:putative copper resistance protein D
MNLLDPLIGVRAVHFAATAIVAGTIFFRHIIAGPALRSEREAPALVRFSLRLDALAAVMLAVALVSGAAWLILESAAISGLPLAEVYAQNVAWTVLTETRFGQVCAIRGVLAILLAAFLFPAVGRNTPRLTGLVAVALAGGVLAALAWVGHAGAGTGWTADLHLASDTLHLLAAGAWIGGLVPLALALASAHRAGNETGGSLALGVTGRFSTLGLVSVGTLLATGTVNTWFLAGSLASLTGTDYGRLLMIKLALFAIMTAVATINRVVLTGRLPDAGALRQLQINCGVEFTLGLAVIVVASVLGTLPPPLHMHHG